MPAASGAGQQTTAAGRGRTPVTLALQRLIRPACSPRSVSICAVPGGTCG